MDHKTLPADLAPMGCSPTFTQETVPAALRKEHALAPDHWGVLHILEGSVGFVDLATDEEREVSAPDLVIIAPEAPHKLNLDGPVTCRIDFFQDIGDRPVGRTIVSKARDEVRLSYERCEAGGDFTERFYQIFLNASPEIAPFFADTDFDKQHQLLRATVKIMVSHEVADPNMRRTLERIGKSHGRSQLDIPPKLYEVWLDSVCETVKALDAEWTEDLEKSWRARLRDAIQIITAAY